MKIDIDKEVERSIKKNLKFKAKHDPSDDTITFELYWGNIYYDEFVIQLEQKY